MSNKMWSYHRLRGADYTILYDGSEIGTIGSKAIVERLVAAANACAMVPSDALKGLDVELMRQEYGALLAACEAAQVWIDRFGEHAPIIFGGEAELSELLRATIARAKGGAK